MKKASLVILIFLCFMVQGCVSVYYLDRQDRIPQERDKGYVKFYTTYETNDKEGFAAPSYIMKKQEHGYDFKITDLQMPAESIPISDRLGEGEYIVLYPNIVACRIENGYKNKSSAEKKGMREFEISEQLEIHYPLIWKSGFSYKPKKFRVMIEKNRVTPVGLNSHFTYQREERLVIRENDGSIRETDDSVKIYGGTLEVKTGASWPISIVPEENVTFSGPRVYEMPVSEIYALAVEASKSLGWDIKTAEENQGHLVVEIPRMFENNKVSFDIGVYSANPGKTQVDLSSHSGWQRWGSYNMALSREKMYEFYTTLDKLTSSHQ